MMILSIFAALSLAGWVYLTLFHGQFWRPLLLAESPAPATWPSIDIIIPARDEAAVLPQSLPSLLAQDYPGAWRILLVDDHSTDGTGAVAKKLAESRGLADRLTVIAAPELRAGWSGKVAAMQAGVEASKADYILFTDADIHHPKHSLRTLMTRAVEQRLDLLSLMVKLRCVAVAEKMLIPAFVFFFGMLYPFARANDPDSRIAAAAGGVMLTRRKALDNIGGLWAIKSALIDDCALAKAIKRGGGELSLQGRIEIALTHDVTSLRAYPTIHDVWRMVARTAFDQLRYSPLLLAGTAVGMGLLFVLPVLMPLLAGFWAALFGMAAWILMMVLYAPMVAFYRLPLVWALTLPVAAMIYIGATLDSARLHWRGKGGQWKGRVRA